MQAIWIADKVYQFPQKWEEVPRKNLPKLIELVYLKGDAGTSYHEILRIVMRKTDKGWAKFCNKYFGMHLVKRVREANALVLHDAFRALTWMYSEAMDVKPFDYISLGGNDTYILPDPDFYALSFGELSDAYVHTQAYVKQLIPGEERLNLLVATLCRPAQKGNYSNDPNWNGDSREPYNEFVAKERAKIFETECDPVMKTEVLIYFAACLNNLFESYDIFSDDENSVGEDYPGQGLFKNQHLLAQKGIYTGLNGVKQANVHEVLLFLQEHKADIMEQIEREKTRNDKLNND